MAARIGVGDKGKESSQAGVKERSNGEKISIFYEGYNTPVPERSPFYWPGMKQRWRRCDFWGNVVLWFPSRNFILALHPYRALSPPLLAAPPTSNIHLYFSRIIVTAMSRASERERKRRIIRRERSSARVTSTQLEQLDFLRRWTH